MFTGRLLPYCYAQGMIGYLYQQGIRIFDYLKFAVSFRERLRENTEVLAESIGVKIEYLRKKVEDKEYRIQKILRKRGEQPGLVQIFGAMEGCPPYRP